MPTIGRAKKRILVVSCSHGHLINKDAAERVLLFKRDYRPHTTVHLGDFIDMSAFMGDGLSNDGQDIASDLRYGLEFVERLSPSLLFMGNHEHRVVRMMHQSKNEAVVFAATEVSNKINAMAKSMRAELVPYNSIYEPSSWRLIGNTAFGHGYLYNEQAARDHAEMLGRPVVFGHIHRLIRQPARTYGAPEGISVGCLCDIPAMDYAGRRRATVAWEVGFGWGEYTDTTCAINLERISSWRGAEIPKANL